MGFLDNYEAARERIERWHRTFPQGRIETSIIDFNAEKAYILVEARGYRNAEDTLPAGIDFAYGYQGAYVQNMKRWFVEDTTTSAIMRVMQLIMGGAERTTKEVMEQVEKLPAKVANAEQDYDYWTTKFGDVPSFATREEAEESGLPTVAQAIDEIKEKLGGTMQAEAPQCKHGHRIWRTGTSAKTGKDWANYSCIERKPNQCDPLWYVFTSDGTWKPQI
jgi:hypothetical protein